jgi:PAS domain S-box-containing protein
MNGFQGDFLRGALDVSPEGVVICDAGQEHSVCYVNAAFCRLTGFGIDELNSQTPRILRSDKHDAVFYEHVWETILEGKVWSGEIVERRKNGELYTVHQTITPLTDGSGEITHFIAVHEDITARAIFGKREARHPTGPRKLRRC